MGYGSGLGGEVTHRVERSTAPKYGFKNTPGCASALMTVRSTASGAVNVSPGCCLRVVIRGHAVSGTATAEIPCKAPSNVASPGSLTKSVSHFLANAVTEAEAAMSESSKLQRTSAHFCQKVGHGVQLSVRKGGHEAACTEQIQRDHQQRLSRGARPVTRARTCARAQVSLWRTDASTYIVAVGFVVADVVHSERLGRGEQHRDERSWQEHVVLYLRFPSVGHVRNNERLDRIHRQGPVGL